MMNNANGALAPLECQTGDASKTLVPRPLDAEIVAYPHQIGGHGAFGNKCKFLQSRNQAVVYKPVQRFPKGVHEVELYERVFDPDCEDQVLLELRNFIPSYKGLFYEPKTNLHYFCMNDLLSSLVNPSICDIKIGRVTYTPDSPPNKIRLEQTKYEWQTDLGFCITAMRLFDPAATDGSAINLDRTYGRSLDPTSVYNSGIRLFLGRDSRRTRLLANLFCIRLKQMVTWFEKQHRFAFYASSLLLAYGNPGTNCDSTTRTSHPWWSGSVPPLDEVASLERPCGPDNDNLGDESIVAYLIDFTRWCELSGSRDDNVLYGLYKLIDLFERAATDRTPPPPIVPPNRVFLPR